MATVSFDGAIVASTADDIYRVEDGITASADGPVVDASAAATGRQLVIKGTLEALSGTAVLFGDATLTASETQFRIEAGGTFKSADIGMVSTLSGFEMRNSGLVLTANTGFDISGNDHKFVNDGVMSSTDGDLIHSSGQATVLSNGSGKVLANGVVVRATGDDLEVLNYKTMRSYADTGVISSGLNTKFENSLSFKAALDGIDSSGDGLSVINSGKMAAGSGAVVRTSGDGAVIVNNKDMKGGEGGILSAGDGFDLTNYGKITASGTALHLGGDDATVLSYGRFKGDIGVKISGDDTTFTNGDKIIGTSKSHAAVVITADGETAFTNAATIAAKSGVAIKAGDGSEHILNESWIDGDVILGGGDDWFSTKAYQVGGVVKGGKGDDIYVISGYLDPGTVMFKEGKGQGQDTIQTDTSWVLGKNFENVTLWGDAVIDATGNSRANVLIGNDEQNTLSGGRGKDVLTGHGGSDLFVFKDRGGQDTITDFENGIDHIDLRKVSDIGDFGELEKHISGDSDHVYIDIGKGGAIVLVDFDIKHISADDFWFT